MISRCNKKYMIRHTCVSSFKKTLMTSARPLTRKTCIIKMYLTRNHSTSSETFLATRKRNNNDVNLDGNMW